jgi:hypothetical protein
MSYHILHQFDEQWLAELTQNTPDANKGKSRMGSFGDGHQHAWQARLAAHESKRWAIVAATILLASCALLFSIDASRRAESLQQRMNTLEKTARK